jgi:hypothetical protein
MSSIAFVEVTSVYDAVDVLFDKIDAFDSDVLSNSERAELLERRQTWRRRLPAGDHELINHLATPSARARVCHLTRRPTPPAPACPPRVSSCVKRSFGNRTCSAIISSS